jgi:hypothetical protein
VSNHRKFAFKHCSNTPGALALLLQFQSGFAVAGDFASMAKEGRFAFHAIAKLFALPNAGHQIF